jgi:hypothetical protein
VIEIPGYRLLRQLGRGGMATVYLALQESVDREVALKVMSPALLVDPDFGERFLREAKIAARLHHRHVVGIHDVGRAGDCHYIAMEYLGGGPVLPKGGSVCEPMFALRVAREIAGALNYAQEKGFVHRDVKPDNILLRDDGSSALTDFGIARALDAAPRMTRTGAVVGTPHYMSPEQARGKQIDGRADLYSLGIVLYEMLVGRVPYHADDSLAIGIMHITQPLPLLPVGLESLQPLLDRLLAKQPEERFQSGSEVAGEIAELERHIGEGSVAAPVSIALAEPPSAQETLFDAPAAGLHGNGARERAEPNLGRMDDLAGALEDEPRRGAPGAPPRRQAARGSRRGLLALAAAIVLVVAAVAAWSYQDHLRRMLPRTGFNDTLAQAQQALEAGRLTGERGDGARELFLAARAQDPDNDIARRGLEQTGRRLLQQASTALERGDLVAARASLDSARGLLGGGDDVERVERAIAQAESRGSEEGQLLDQAAAALAAGRITGAQGAATLYQRVLANDSGNAVAQAGLGKAADALAVRARTALAASDPDTAAARADDIARIVPNWPGLPDLLGRIAQARDARRATTAATLQQADAQVRAGNLAGSDDAALELYRSVLASDPSNAGAKDGLRRIAQSFVTRARAAIDDDNADAAAKLLDSAAGIAPVSPELRAARSDLAELRERLAIDAQRPPVTPADSARVQALVSGAAAAVAAGHLILPPGESAYDKYRAALAIDGNNAQALAGMAALPARAKDLFEQALADGTPQRALAYLDSVRQVAPEDAAIPAMTARLASAFLDLADSRMGAGRRADAASALAAASHLRPQDPRLAQLEARLRAMEAGRE